VEFAHGMLTWDVMTGDSIPAMAAVRHHFSGLGDQGGTSHTSLLGKTLVNQFTELPMVDGEYPFWMI